MVTGSANLSQQAVNPNSASFPPHTRLPSNTDSDVTRVQVGIA